MQMVEIFLVSQNVSIVCTNSKIVIRRQPHSHSLIVTVHTEHLLSGDKANISILDKLEVAQSDKHNGSES